MERQRQVMEASMKQQTFHSERKVSRSSTLLDDTPSYAGLDSAGHIIKNNIVTLAQGTRMLVCGRVCNRVVLHRLLKVQITISLKTRLKT